MSLAEGTVIDRYRVERLLGEGGFGAVYLARHTVMGRAVALKVLHTQEGENPQVLERFIQEAQAAAAIGNEHIVQVFDCGITGDGQPFLAMERLDGEDLEARLTKGVMSVPWLLSVFRQVLAGLRAAHAAGIVHRDMKPANIFLCKTEHGDFVKLLDFGISKVHKPAGMGLTRTGMVLGTPHYMSPELFSGAVHAGPATDIYAVGIMLYQALSGQMPYDAQTYERLIVQVATQAPAHLSAVAPQVPRELADLVMKCMEKSPEDRYATADAVLSALATTGVSERDFVDCHEAKATFTGHEAEVSSTGTGPIPFSTQKDTVGASFVTKQTSFPRRRVFVGLVVLLALIGTGVYFVKTIAVSPQISDSSTFPAIVADASRWAAHKNEPVDAGAVFGPDAIVRVVAPDAAVVEPVPDDVENRNRAGRWTSAQKKLLKAAKNAIASKNGQDAWRLGGQLQRTGALNPGRFIKAQAACLMKDLSKLNTLRRQLPRQMKKRLASYCASVGFSP